MVAKDNGGQGLSVYAGDNSDVSVIDFRFIVFWPGEGIL